MPVRQKKVTVSKFPLRLMPSVRRVAENFSEKEGVSLNQFINIAVAEKLAHLQHEEWLAHRPKATDEMIANALAILDRPTGQEPEDGDRLPKSYRSGAREAAPRLAALGGTMPSLKPIPRRRSEVEREGKK
jgi:hypothetical protein